MVMGTRSDTELLAQFTERLGRAVAVSASVSLGTVAALFSRCSLFLGSDSAQKHIAAAVGVPVIEVSCHPANGDPGIGPARFHAWGVSHTVHQPIKASKPCSWGCEALTPHCILDVAVDDVERSAAAQLALREPRNSHSRV